jgi:hypothetical protein
MRLRLDPSVWAETALRGAAALRLTQIAVVLCIGAASTALAETGAVPTDQQQQTAPPPNALPAAQQNPSPAPAAAPAAPDVQSCLQETGDYVTHGTAITYVIGIANTCDKRIKCKIDAYVVGAKGPASGHTTMTLGAQSSGAAAKKSYAMKVKAAGGTAQVSRDCQFL